MTNLQIELLHRIVINIAVKYVVHDKEAGDTTYTLVLHRKNTKNSRQEGVFA
jgi:hypothetical protein